MKGRTRWYPGNINPVRAGWYERLYEAFDDGFDCFDEEIYLDWWSGTYWFMAYDEKHKRASIPSAVQRKWRGRNYPGGNP